MQKNKILNKTWILATLIATYLLTSCGGKQAKPVQIEYIDFVEQLDQLSQKHCGVAELNQIRSKHSLFFKVWFSEIMDYSQFVNFPDSVIADRFNYWVQVNRPVFQALKKHYSIHTQWKPSLEQQWANLIQELPKTPVPVVYGYMSQFSNYNTFTIPQEKIIKQKDTVQTPLIIGFSKEMFMNDTFPLYKALDVPSFYERYNNPIQIPTMMIWNYLNSTYAPKHRIKTMIDQMMFDGKMWALMTQISDQPNPYDILGYTQEEWAMMEKDQGQIWKHFLDQKALFSSNFNEYRRYFVYGNKTFGSGIPADCPPMIGSFIGMKIIQKYKSESGATWEEIFNETDAAKILRISGYNPVR